MLQWEEHVWEKRSHVKTGRQRAVQRSGLIAAHLHRALGPTRVPLIPSDDCAPIDPGTSHQVLSLKVPVPPLHC